MTTVAPEISIEISPQLRLLRASGGLVGAEDGPAGAMVDAGQGDSERQQLSHTAPARSSSPVHGTGRAHDRDVSTETGNSPTNIWASRRPSRISLRRDGARPLRFVGAPLLRLQTVSRMPPGWTGRLLASEEDGDLGRPVAFAVQRLDLYLERSGQLAAAVSLDFDDSVGARPHYKAALIGSVADLEHFIAGYDPTQAFVGRCEGPIATEFMETLTSTFASMLRESRLCLSFALEADH
jgi:hypothetical protein